MKPEPAQESVDKTCASFFPPEHTSLRGRNVKIKKEVSP